MMGKALSGELYICFQGEIQYLFHYKMGFFSSLECLQITKSVLLNFVIILLLLFLNHPKDLELSYKMDLDFWDCFGMK